MELLVVKRFMLVVAVARMAKIMVVLAVKIEVTQSQWL